MKLNPYEGMFLFDPSVASKWDMVVSEVGRIMERAEAELIGLKKWDERRLAYEIERRKRGCYVLAYFKARGSSIAGIERDVQLSEMVLRLLVLRCDLSDEELDAFRKEAGEQSEALLKAQEEAAKPPEPEPVEAAVPDAAPAEAPAEASKAADDTSKAADEAPEVPVAPEATEKGESTEQKDDKASEPAQPQESADGDEAGDKKSEDDKPSE